MRTRATLSETFHFLKSPRHSFALRIENAVSTMKRAGVDGTHSNCGLNAVVLEGRRVEAGFEESPGPYSLSAFIHILFT